MSNLFNAADLAAMRSTQIGHMQDTCHRLVYSASADSYGQLVPTWTESNTDIVCGLDPRPGNENMRQDATVLHHDATIRLPLSEIWDPKDRIKITKRYGETLSTPITYGIVGPIQRGPSGIRLQLEKVEPSD